MSEAANTAAAPAPVAKGVSAWWRALSILLALALLVGWAASASLYEQLKAQIQHLQTRLAQVPQVRQIAVLLDAQGQPAMLITHNPQEAALAVQRLNAVREGREDSMQIWGLAPGQAPRSLGVITSRYQTLQLPLKAEELQGLSELGISAENKGGVPEAAGPSLPWLFKGALVTKAI